MEVLQAKGGDVDKELYTLGRSKASDDYDSGLGLRYDLTVPLARYVAAHFGELAFPFKRYHIGDCWRGERPQDGRYRQFKQADIDVLRQGPLPLSFDADIPLLASQAIRIMGVEDYVFRISNRKILGGYLSGLGLENQQAITRILDKLDKIGRDSVLKTLQAEASLTGELAESVLRIATISSTDLTFVDKIRELGVTHPTLEKGVAELEYVMKRLTSTGGAEFQVDLSITRGFDYYTGSVYEVKWKSQPHIGSIAAGGRYDDLSSNFFHLPIPGVGMSIGISRIFGKLVQVGQVPTERVTSSQVLVVWDRQDTEESVNSVASALRTRGVNVEAFHEPSKLAKQLEYADRKGIAFVVFPRFGEVRRMRDGKQKPFVIEHFTLDWGEETPP